MGRIYKRGDTWWGYWRDARGQKHQASLRTKDRGIAYDRLRRREAERPGEAAQGKPLGEALRGTKTEGSDRLVPIAAELRPWLEAAAEEGDGFVLQAWGNVRRGIKAACKRAGVPACTPNDLRRTFASWLKQAGVDSLAVAKLMGHASTRMVDLVYGQLHRCDVPGRDRQDADDRGRAHGLSTRCIPTQHIGDARDASDAD